DDAEAARWYRLAAEQDLAQAQNNLGVMYEYGRGVPQDYVQAHKWYNLAASRSPASDDVAVKNRDIVAAKMTPAQIAEAQRLAREWRPRR
ncbi:MAG: sel1 repeat family protein, partial [Alphaproteobacteria bacterium]|nr:sel1 repeat family protein [Alphaproteobacteria bacterium]